MARAFLIGFAFLALVAGGPACASGAEGESSAAQSVRADPRGAAREYLRLIRRYDRQEAAAVPVVIRRADDDLSACAAASDIREERTRRDVEALVHAFAHRAMLDKMQASRYAPLAAKLQAIPTANRALRRVLRAADVVAAEAKKLQRADVDVCGWVSRWRDTGWDAEQAGRLLFEPYHEVGYDFAKTRAAREQATRSTRPLQKLGLSFMEALAVSSIPFAYP